MFLRILFVFWECYNRNIVYFKVTIEEQGRILWFTLISLLRIQREFFQSRADIPLNGMI